MKKKPRMSRDVLLTVVVLAILNLFVSGRYIFWAAAWVAPILTLRLMHTHKLRRGLWLAFLGTYFTTAIVWYGATPIWGPAHFIFMLVNIGIGFVPFLLDRLIVPRMRHADGSMPFVATLVFPAAATAFDFLLSSSNPIGNFGALGYSQVALLPVVQSTALFGMLGLTFLLSWFASIAHWAWTYQRRLPVALPGVIGYALLLVALIGYGSLRLNNTPDNAGSVQIASFTLEEIHVPDYVELMKTDLDAFRAQTTALHERYLDATVQAAEAGAELVLWPEAAGIGISEDVDALIANGQTIAQEQGIYLGLPYFRLFPNDEQVAENKLLVIEPSGAIGIEHVKFGGNMLEGTLAGSGDIPTLDTPFGRIAAIICWDTDFPATVRQIGEQGVDMLLSPSLEWSGIDPMHAQMAQFRAVENGVTVIRQADKGLSVVIDPFGRIINEARGAEHMISAEIAVESMPTPYATTVKESLGVVSIAILMLSVVYGVAMRRKPADVPSVALGD